MLLSLQCATSLTSADFIPLCCRWYDTVKCDICIDTVTEWLCVAWYLCRSKLSVSRHILLSQVGAEWSVVVGSQAADVWIVGGWCQRVHVWHGVSGHQYTRHRLPQCSPCDSAEWHCQWTTIAGAQSSKHSPSEDYVWFTGSTWVRRLWPGGWADRATSVEWLSNRRDRRSYWIQLSDHQVHRLQHWNIYTFPSNLNLHLWHSFCYDIWQVINKPGHIIIEQHWWQISFLQSSFVYGPVVLSTCNQLIYHLTLSKKTEMSLLRTVH